MKYLMDDGVAVDTKESQRSWSEEWEADEYWDKPRGISSPSRHQWRHEELHRTKKGRYYIEKFSPYYDPEPSSARWVTKQYEIRNQTPVRCPLPVRVRGNGGAMSVTP